MPAVCDRVGADAGVARGREHCRGHRDPAAGSLVVLESLAEAHTEGLWRAAQAPEIWRWTSHIADSREDFDAWIAASLSCMRDGEKHTFATLDRATGSPIGSTSFHHFRPQDSVIEIGSTWLNPRAWRTGANAEAKLLMMEHAFETLGCVGVRDSAFYSVIDEE